MSDSVRDDASREAWAARVRDTETLFKTTVENIPLNMVLIDREGRLMYMNPTLAAQVSRMCNRAPEELLGEYGADIWPEKIWTPLHHHFQRALATGERQSWELEASYPDGTRTVRQWMAVPVVEADGHIPQVLAMSHDITEQRVLLDEVRQADRRKSEFIAMLSHELRNPLAAINAGLHVLAADPVGGTAQRMREILGRQVGHLVRMVDDLLDITRIGQNHVRLQPVRLDVNRLVRDTLEDNRATLERDGVRFEAGGTYQAVYVMADRTRIAQVVTNLLSNAAKFTHAGGVATITVEVDGSANCAVITVTDDGIGIDPAFLPRVFEPFMQGERTLERSGGLGLGLALVKGLVTLHGGEVTARSEGVSHGTEVVVRLPLAPPGELPISRPTPFPTKPRRVLLIEDDRDIAEALQTAIGFDSHDVVVAHDGHDGLDKARQFRPDIVLCDIGLPGMNGYDIARAFRREDELQAMYLVALTGYAQREDLAKARDAGFDHHLAKPMDLDELRELLAAPRYSFRASGL